MNTKIPPLLFIAFVAPLLAVTFSACSTGYAGDNAGQTSQPAGEAAGAASQSVQLSWTVVRPPNDRYLDRQWAYEPMRRMIGTGGGDKLILVAVLDTGIDAMHEDLIGNVVDEVNFSGSQTAMDIYAHGTHVAGIIAAHADNKIGIAGLSQHARLINVKVADDQGRVFPSDLAKGIVWAVDRGAQVINISLCISNGNGTLEKAVDYAWSKGVVIVAAAGNCRSAEQAPACYPHVISAGALDNQLEIWEKSNQGDCVNAYAPGVGIYSCRPDNSYGYVTGTSAAAAMISAAAAEFLTTAVDENANGFVNDEVFTRLKGAFAYSSGLD